MQNISADLDRARERLRAEKSHQQWDYRALAECLEKYASMFHRTSRDQHRDLIARFHNCAGKLPYVFDWDFGALLLEATAAEIDDRDLRVWLLTEARFRATWCAQAGTAGGECLARYRHVKRLDERLHDDA
jgi:hypothetical protein